MDLYQELRLRGLVKDVSDEKLVRKLLGEGTTLYCGFDPSAPSLQLGNFVMISLLMRLQRAGCRVIAVLGGGTGLIGDPSGKSRERPLLSEEALRKNSEKVRDQLGRFLDFKDPRKGLIVDNRDWLGKLDVLSFLRDYGKHFPVNYILAKDIVARRLEAGISYAEFSYSILQAVDFLHLYRKYGCRLQLGGGDQWGNLTAGLELIRKAEGSDVEAAVVAAPLLLDEGGRKFGKSEGGAIYLDGSLYSPYRLYQYLLNASDASVMGYLKVFSFRSLAEIDGIAAEHAKNPEKRIAQKALAYELTSLIHGKEKADEAVRMSAALFGGDVKHLSEASILELFSDMLVEADEGLPLEDLLVAAKAATSRRDARELINGGAVRINGEKARDPKETMDRSRALFGRYVIIRKGRKSYRLVRFGK